MPGTIISLLSSDVLLSRASLVEDMIALLNVIVSDQKFKI
jgi:hypothetical protein